MLIQSPLEDLHRKHFLQHTNEDDQMTSVYNERKLPQEPPKLQDQQMVQEFLNISLNDFPH